MATNLALASIKATGGTTSRTIGNRFADIINVLDYGAKGDGIADDTAAIQAAFNAAFGTVASPNGAANAALNKDVFFPAGTYKTTATLNLHSIMGGHIFGAGQVATTIVYSGPTPGGSTLTSLLYINGMAYSIIEGIQFKMTGRGAALSTLNSVCINWTWDNLGDVNATANEFRDLTLANCTYGILVGNAGFQCDDSLFVNCTLSNFWYGIKTCQGNALNHMVIGGGCNTFLGAGYYAAAGGFGSVLNAAFASGGGSGIYDIQNDGGNPIAVVGTRTESASFLESGIATTLTMLQGINQDSGTTGHFVNGAGSVIIDSCYSLNGDLGGSNTAAFYIKNSNFVRYDFQGASIQTIEIENSFIGYPLSIGRYIANQRITSAQGTRTYKVEASSLSDPQFLYDSYAGQGSPQIGGQGAYVTITIASPGVFALVSPGNNQLNFQAGIPVAFTTSSALPTGLSTGTVYWISTAGLSQTQFQVADTKAHALAGTNSINTSGSQSGNQTMYFVRTYAVGDQILNNGVTAGGSPGWICTTAGVSVGVAVFKALANVAA